jgi:hypothetical protein
MNSPAGELSEVLASLRTLDGWTVTRLDTGDHRVSSPQGTLVVGAITAVTDDDVLEILVQLDRLGYADSHRMQPRRSRTTAEREAAARSAAQQTPDFILSDHKEAPTMANGTAEILRLTVRTASPDPTRNGGKRHTKSGVLITPNIAEAFKDLIDTDHNRNERPANRKKFARIITAGKFQHTHQGLGFNTEGKLSDGQHRILGFLDALAEDPSLADDESRWPVVDITYNLPVDTAFALDGGATRNAKDHAAVAGIADFSKVVPLVQFLHRYHQGHKIPNSWRDLPALLPDEIPPLCEEYGEELLQAHTEVRRAMRRGGHKTNVNAFAVGYYLAVRAWDGHIDGKPWKTEVVDGKEVPLHPVDDFLDAVSEDTRRPRNSPQRALSTWLLGAANQQRRGIDNPQTYLAMFLLAYNDYVNGNERNQMSWVPVRGIPQAFRPAGVEDHEE